MCDTCFNTEINRFNTYQEHEKFDLELSKKLNSTSGLKYLGGSKSESIFGYDRYVCQDCQVEWWYSKPDQAWRGFFVTKDNGERILEGLKKENKRTSLGCVVVLIVMAGVLWFIFKNYILV